MSSSEKKGNLVVRVEEKRNSPRGSPDPVAGSVLTARSPRTTRFVEMESPSKKAGFQGSPIVTNSPSTAPISPAPYSSGYSGNIKHTSVAMPATPMTPGMRTATSLKVPGTPGRYLDPRSPTFREELKLEKEELKADRQNARDLKVKIRIRIAKFFLRGVNFGCSLIVLSMLGTSLSIFNASKLLSPRNNLPPWANNQQVWPQIVLLVIACLSLVICVGVMWGYWRGGHKRAAKAARYHTMTAIGIFLFSTLMWIVGAVVLHQSRANGNGQDMWGWSCNMNKRETLFNDEVDYALVCRLMNWNLICALIEVVVEVISIAIYAVIFYRFRSRRKLTKAMDGRDKARSDLYLAQLKLQSAPNTPGYAHPQMTGKGAMRSAVAPTFGAISEDRDLEAANEYDEKDMEYQRRYEATFGNIGAALSPPPAIAVTGATPQMGQGKFAGASSSSSAEQHSENVQEHMSAADGEQTYEAVPIPGAYADAKKH